VWGGIDVARRTIELSEAWIQRELDRRRPGQSKVGNAAKEKIDAKFFPVSLGAKHGHSDRILVRNKDARPRTT